MDLFWKILELLAMAFGVVYVVLEVKKAHSMWLFMIIASVFNLLVYFNDQYVSMGLIQFYYFFVSAYGIRAWAKERKMAAEQHGGVNPETEGKLLVRRFEPRKAIISFAIAMACFVGLSALLNSSFDLVELKGNVGWLDRAIDWLSKHSLSYLGYRPEVGDIPGKPFWDAGVAVLSMLATYWLGQSWREQWYIWLVVNVGAVIMFVYPFFHGGKGLLWMGLLYVIYIVSCIVGLYKWYRQSVIVEE